MYMKKNFTSSRKNLCSKFSKLSLTALLLGLFSFGVKAQSPYCDAPYTGQTYCTTYFMAVNAMKITSSCGVTVYDRAHVPSGVGNQGCKGATSYYTLLSSSPMFTLVKGAQYTFGVTTGPTYAVNMFFFIDLNGDNDFLDADEWLNPTGCNTTGQVPNNTASYTNFTFTIPTSGSATTTRLRVRSRYGPSGCPTGSNPACDDQTYGEAEDYTISLSTTSNDVGIASLVSPTNICGGNPDPFVVRISNLGTTAISSSTSIPVVMTLSGVGSGTYNKTFTRGLAVGACDTIHMTSLNTSSWKGVLNVKAYSNLSSDGNVLNDTMVTSMNMVGTPTPFSGTYSVGPTGKFASLKSAIDSCLMSGVNGNVTLELQSNYNSSVETFPITIASINANVCGTVNSNPSLTIRPSAAATNLVISGNSSSALFILDNTRRVTFDGRPGGTGTSRQLFFSNTNTAGTVFTLQNDAIRNTIQYCEIRSANTTSTSGAIFLGSSTRFWGNDSNTIANNLITRTAWNTTLASGITSNPASNLLFQNDNNTISNNEIYSFLNFGINIASSLGNGEKWSITGNSLYDSVILVSGLPQGNTSTSWTAINFTPGTTANSIANVISGNFIGGSMANCGGSPLYMNSTSTTMGGIRITSSLGTPTLVQNNIIQNISFLNVSNTATFMGINPAGGSMIVGGAPGKGNTIGDAATSGSISSKGNNPMIGISSSSSGDMVISYNLIANITQDHSTGTTGAIRGIVNTGGSIVFITNNTIRSFTTNIANAGSTTSACLVGIINQSGSANLNILDNTIGGINGSDALNSTSTTGQTRILGLANFSGIGNIKRNKINGLFSSAPSTSTTTSAAIIGIYNSSTAGTVLDANEIRNMVSTAAASTAVLGIYIGSVTDITNNVVSGIYTSSTSASTTTSACIQGIYYGTSLTATILNNTFENFSASALSSNQIIGINTASTNTFIRNNKIRNIWSRSTSTGTTTSSSIIGIYIASASANKIITGNQIYNLENYNPTTASGILGIYYLTASTFGNNSMVDGNFIHSFKLYTTGIGLMTGIYMGSGIATFQNNMIRLGVDSTGNDITGPYNIKGIVHGVSTSSNYYHNSIYLGGASAGTTNTACMEFLSTITSTETVNLRNNIFYNNIANSSSGRNACIRIISNGRIFSNYNLLYAPSTNGAVGIINTTAYNSLLGTGGWCASTLLDGQSASVDPGFVAASGSSSTVDMHLNSNNPAEGAGDPFLSNTLTDYDGQSRASLSPSDIGADASNSTISTDNLPPTINHMPLFNTSSTGDRTFLVNILDNKGMPLSSSANAPRVYFKKSTGSYSSSPGTLSSGNLQNGMWSFTISASTLGGLSTSDIINYYILAQDSAANIASNAMFAIASNVNSVSTPPTTPNAYTIVATLSTTIQVGTGQPFTSLTASGTGLFEAINNTGLSANTVVEITSDLSETGAVGLNQWNETGSGGYTLTIRPSSGRVQVIGTGTGGMIRLNGADRVKISGIPAGGSTSDTLLFIKCTGSTPAITLQNDATFNLIENCVLEGNPTAVLINSTGIVTGNDNNTFNRCHIRATNGTGMTNGIQSLGQTPTAILPFLLNDNITISECQIYNFTNFGITCVANGAGNRWRILNNHFYWKNSAAATASQTSINFSPGIVSNSDTISGNFIGGGAPNAGGSAWKNSVLSVFTGILVSAGTQDGVSIQGNTIKNIYFTNTGTLATQFVGINLSGGGVVDVGGSVGNTIGDLFTPNSILADGDMGLIGITSTTAFKLTVSNNTIANLNSKGGTVFTSTAVRGIIITGGTGELNVVNNTVQSLTALSRATGSTTAAAVAGIVVGSSGNVQNILNNKIAGFRNMDNVGTHCMVGIALTSGLNMVKGNSVKNFISSTANTTALSAATGIQGIFSQSNQPLSEYSNNSVSDLQYVSATPTSGQMIGINILTNSNIKVSQNTVSSLRSMTISSGTVTSMGMIGLNYYGAGLLGNLTQNTVHSISQTNAATSNPVNIAGIFYYTTSSITPSVASRNNVHSLKLSTSGAGTMYGIYNWGYVATFENNMIRIGIDSSGNAFTGPYNVYGISQIFSNSNVNYYHNSIYLGGSPSSGSSTSAAFSLPAGYPYSTTTTRMNLKNNIFVNAINNTGSATGKNYALQLASPTLIYSNNNILYAPGAGGFVGNNIAVAGDYTTLSGASSWQLATGLDLNSASVNPNFVDATGAAFAVDLRLSSSNPVEGQGSSDVSTTVDFDGNLRSSRTPYDIGAHSGNFSLSSDAFAPVITFNPLTNGSNTSGNRTLANVRITDNVGIPMTGSGIPRIYFNKNSGTWYSSAASSLSGSSTNAMAGFDISYTTLGGVSVGDTIRYFVVAADNAGNIISNGLYAVASDVSTVSVNPVNPMSYRIVNALAAGTKLRVGAGKTYTSLSGTGGLFEYLNSVSLGGDITAVISSNTNEPGTVTLNELGDNGNGTFTLTIRPDSLTTGERLLSGNAATMIRLEGTDRVKFTGVPDFNGAATDRKLRFRNSNTGGQVFLFINEATNNRLHNLIIESGNISLSAASVQFSTSNKLNGNSFDTVSNCLFEHDRTGIFPAGMPITHLYSFGDVGKENHANVLMDNEISNFTQYGIWLSNVGNGNNWKIINNHFYRSHSIPAFAFQYGIYMEAQFHSGGHKLNNNYFGGSAKNCGGSPWVNNANVDLRCISFTSGSLYNSSEIKGNTIQNIRRPNVGSSSIFTGIFVQNNVSANIENNLVGSPSDLNSIVLSGGGQQNGITFQSNGSCNLENNMVQGINLNMRGVASTFVGIFVSNGMVSIKNNTVGSMSTANSIQHSGTGSLIGIQSQMASSSAMSVLIDNNVVANMSSYGTEAGITLRGIFNTSTTPPTITNNRLFNLSTYSSSVAIIAPTAITGIGVTSSNFGGMIANNTIYNLSALNNGTVSTSAVGIGMNGSNNLMIKNNRIYNISNASTLTNIAAPPTVVGVSISSPQNAVTIQNNQISLGKDQTNSPMFIGIWQSASGNFRVNSYYNSIYIRGTASSGVQSSFGYLRGNNFVTSSYISIVDSRNNIFMNERSGGTGKHYAIGNQNVITTFQTGWQTNASNFNLLSNLTGNPVGLWNFSDYNFTDWKLNGMTDLNSINLNTGTAADQIDPSKLFTDPDNGNLTLINTNNEKLKVAGKATPLANVSDDYSNLMRSTMAPTIGSSEVLVNDMTLVGIRMPLSNTCGKATTTVTITLRNLGTSAASNIPVNLNITGSVSQNANEVVAGPIAPLDTLQYTFTSSFNSLNGGTYNIRATSNLVLDGDRRNDTSRRTLNIFSMPKPSFTYSDTCFGNSVNFTSTSTVTGSTISSNTWRFGDGSNGTGNTTSKSYAVGGMSYSVKIISTSAQGCKDSSARTINILTPLVGGTVNANQTICYNSTPTLITNSALASGSKAPYTYQWQSSANNVDFTNISGSTGLDYQPGTLTATRYYRRMAMTTSGCGPSYSNTVTISVNPILTSGTIGSAQTICLNGTGTPLAFSTNPTGGFGTYTYQWQQSSDSTSWSNISGQTGNSYTPTNVTAVLYYRVLVTSGVCASVGSNGIKIKLFSPIAGGSIAAGQTICAGTAPAAFTQVTAPSGGPGTYTFQWESSTDSINWSNISGATSSTLTPGSILTLTYYRRLAQSTGCPSGVSNALKVKTNPKPNVVNTASNHCFNDPMPVTNSSTISSGTLTYLWKFGDGTTSTSSVPNKTYSSSGTYSVTLIATSNLGCKDSSVKSVIVATTPTPSFTFTLKCQGDSAIFVDNTVYACGAGSGLTFFWNFGDGSTSNVQHARHKYNSPGTYSVKFRIALPGGFKDSITKTVVFNIRSTPAFTATNVCFPGATSFTNSSSNYASLLWSYGDATTSTTTSASYTKSFASAGNYDVKLVSTSSFGCKDSITKTVSVFTKPVAAFSTSNNCIGFSTSFSNSSNSATSYAWNFGDGNTSTSISPSNTYAAAGTYNVKLKVTSVNGCTDSVIKQVTIHPNPVAGFNAANVCLGFASSFTNTSTGGSTYAWNFGNGNASAATSPTYTYPTAGTYTVTLTATSANGCIATTSKSHTVNSSPKADFTGSNVCLGLGINFNNSSTGNTTNSWNFGDATTSSTASPTKTYATAGNFNVKLVIANTFGCKDSVTKTVTIFPKPVPAFTANNHCFGNAVSFTNQSTGATATVWVFGDGKSSAASSPTYTYAASGTYTAKLIVTSANGCKDSLSKTITVYPKPNVSFSASPNPICRGGLMSFTNTTTNGSTYQWTFGNGNTSTQASPTNIYNSANNYTVKLVATSTNGCKDSVTQTVTVWPRPVASFKVSDGCTNDNLAFASNSISVAAHAWTFGDATTSAAANPSKAYSTPGTYSVRLIVTSINGCTDTTTSNVTVNPRASVSFTNGTNFCVGLSTTFTNTSSLSSGSMNHQWSFGDGNSSVTASPSYTYGAAGNYTVMLTVTTDKGCVNTNSSSVVVFAKPVVNFTANSVCAGSTVSFTNTSTGGTTYAWDFGNSNTSTSMSPTQTYANPGTYTVKLTVTSANGCVETLSKQLVIHANPVSSFNAADRCIGQAINFTNASTGAADYNWQFGDGNSSNQVNPSNNYTAPGSYTVSLTVKTLNGCANSSSKTVVVYPAPKAGFSINDDGQCLNGNNFVFTDNSSISSGSISNRAWTFGDGGTSSLTNPAKNYAGAGSYAIRLVVTSGNGCKDSSSSMVMVHPKPTAGFNISNSAQCLNINLFNITDASTIASGSMNRSWTMGDGSSMNGTNLVKKYAMAGTYTIRLMVVSDRGCTDSTSKSVTIHPNPTASFTVNNNRQCFIGNVFNYTNTTSGVATYNTSWNLGDGSTVTTTNASRSYASAGSYNVKLNVGTAQGCKDSAYYVVRVLPSPGVINVSGPTTAQQGSTQTYSVPFTLGSNYNWSAVNGTVLSNGANIVQVKWNPSGTTGSLSVTETGSNECKGLAANYNVTLTLVGSVSQSLKNAFASRLYPNPAGDNFTVEVSIGGMVNMTIYDELGRIVMENKRFNSSITISDHNLAAGIYQVKLSTDEGKTAVLRFEVKH